jgi:hypothetical protein
MTFYKYDWRKRHTLCIFFIILNICFLHLTINLKEFQLISSSGPCKEVETICTSIRGKTTGEQENQFFFINNKLKITTHEYKSEGSNLTKIKITDMWYPDGNRISIPGPYRCAFYETFISYSVSCTFIFCSISLPWKMIWLWIW